jgi:hypothetical protein
MQRVRPLTPRAVLTVLAPKRSLSSKEMGPSAIEQLLPGVNYIEPRIDSFFLLPTQSSCLI